MKPKLTFFLITLLLLFASRAYPSPGPPALWPQHVELGRFLFLAAKALIPGKVLVRCHLDHNGKVTLAEIIEGHPMLAEASAENSLGWTFLVDGSGLSEVRFVELTYEYNVEDGVRPDRRFDIEVSVDFPYRVVTLAKPRQRALRKRP